MPRLSSRVPSYRKHKASGQAIVTIAGKDHYLGPHGTAASKRAYDRLICEFLQSNRRGTADAEATTVAQLANAYLRFAKGYYVKNGKSTKEVDNIRLAIKRIKAYHDVAVTEFGPLAFQAVQRALIDGGLALKTINSYGGIIKRMFRWGVAQELVPAHVAQALGMVPGCRKGRSGAREPEPVTPVDDAMVAVAIAQLPQVVADMVRVQHLTGMRPQDVCNLRPCDLDRDGDVWLYQPSDHKTTHLGRARVIFVGPKAQEILLRYLVCDAQVYCFSPADSEAKRLAGLHAARKTPKSCGNRPGTNRKASPKRKPREKYTTDSYRRAIHRACDKAGIPRWSPNRIRHTAATNVRKRFGLEAAQIILGHSRADVTQVYAERDLARGSEVARQIG
ncbi:MAG: site-specific integrase [Pirellulales bacterium]|nr:site-specific integrase [Pirellulales bacterium]